MPLPQALADQYDLGRLVGRGGTADVYDGVDRQTGRRVAIKVLSAEAARDPLLVSRFVREAEIARALDHPAIVAVLDSGEVPGTTAQPDEAGCDNETEQRTETEQRDQAEQSGDTEQSNSTVRSDDTEQSDDTARYIVMEYVDGRTLRWILRNGPVPIPTALKIAHGVLAALEHAHAAGVVHRDIKPGNVMIATTGQVKVMDFGTAWARGTTEPAQVVGTVQYMSPEHIRGEQVDPRSDLYSVGCLLFQLVTGRPPFVGDDQATVAAQQVTDPPPAPSTLNPYLPAALDRVLLAALAKDRADRPQTATQMRAELRAMDPPRPSATSGDTATVTGPRSAPTEEIALVPAGPTETAPTD